MGLLDALRGRGRGAGGAADADSGGAAGLPSSAATQEALDSDAAAGPALTAGGAAEGLEGAAGGGPKLYNPYDGIHGGLDVRQLGRIRLPESPEYLFTEEATVKRRSWGENLTFYTGAGWLGGSAVGGAIGVAQGASARTELPGGAAAKRRVNTLLNKTFSHGRGFGNALGALGLLYAGLDSLIAYATDEKLRDDVNSIAAAAAAGAVYRSGAGPRSAAVAALFGGAAAGALHGASWAAGGFR